MRGALALADGTILRGTAVGATGMATGEVVFNTAMTGYQEIVTDPSYAGQVVVNRFKSYDPSLSPKPAKRRCTHWLSK